MTVLFFVFGGPNKALTSANSAYMVYNNQESKIYLLEEHASIVKANQSYTASDGTPIEKGTSLYLISITLRNDYTTDNPPPPQAGQVPISPADGTAYLYLTSQVYNANTVLITTDVSISDFTLPTLSGTGLVVPSGTTLSANIYLSTAPKNVDKYQVNLSYLGDSIPLNNK